MGRPYTAMEYLDGQDLVVFSTRRTARSNRTRDSNWILQAAEASAEAHSLGIVTEISSWMICSSPGGPTARRCQNPLFPDFKIAIGRRSLSLTQTQSLLGRLRNISRNNALGTDERFSSTDIWSLGTVLYEVLEGQRPSKAESSSGNAR